MVTAPSYPSTATALTFSGAGTATATNIKLYDAESVTLTATQGTTSGAAALTVGSAPVSQFALTPTTSTPTAGVAFNVAIAALDLYGNAATSYTGAKTIVWSGPHSSPGPVVTAPSYPSTATALTFSGAGTATATNIKLYDAESVTLTATQGTTSGAAALTVGSAPVSQFALTPTTSTPTAGVAFNVAIAALDLYGNAATSYTGAKTIVWSGPHSSPGPVVTAPSYPSTATALTFSGAGTATATNIKLYDAESVTLTATQGTTSGAAALTVGSAPVSQFALTPTTSTPTAGVAFNVAIAALDLYGNAATSYTGAKTIVWSGPHSSPGPVVTAPSYPSTATGLTFSGAGTATATNITLYDAESVTLTATQGATSGGAALTVGAGTATSITKTTGDNQSTPISTPFPTLFSAKVTDAYGNAVFGIPVTFTAPAGGGSPVAGSQSFSDSGTSAAVGLSTVHSTSDGEVIFMAANGSLGSSGSFTAPSNLPASINDTHGSGAGALFAGSPPQSSASVGLSASAAWGAIAVETGSASPSLAAWATNRNVNNVQSSTFTLNPGSSYIVFASNWVSSGTASPMTLTPSSFTTQPTFTPFPSTQSFASGNGSVAGWYLNGGSGSGTVTVTVNTSSNIRSYIAIVEIPATTGGASGTFSGTCMGTTCAATSNASGVATASTFTANSTGGSYNVSASGPSTNPVDFALSNMATTTTVVSSSANPSTSGQSVTLTATVAPTSGGGAPTGTANFKDGAATISGCGSQTVGGSGPYTATCTTSGLTLGLHTITAVYSGDSNFLTSSSPDFTQTVSSALTYSTTGTVTNWSNSGSMRTVDYPAGTHANDLLFLVFVNTATSSGASISSGWTPLADNFNNSSGSSNDYHFTVWYRLAGGSESSASVNPSGGTYGSAYVIRYVRAGGYPPNPIIAATEQAGNTGGTSSGSLTPTTVATSQDSATEITFFATDSSSGSPSLSTPHGFTSRNVVSDSTGGSYVGVADQYVATSGTTPTAPTWSRNSGSAHWMWVTIAFS